MSQNLIFIDHKKYAKGHVFSGQPEDVYHFKLKDVGYLYAEYNGHSYSTVVQEPFDVSLFESKINEFISDKDTKKLVFKIIGPAALVAKMERKLKELSCSVDNAVNRNSEYEIYHFFDTGKLKLSKEVALQSPSQQNNIKKVLIVDDSQTIRSLLTTILQSDHELQVVAAAEGPHQVEELIKKHQPHVMTLDIHMPEKDGVTLLKELMPKYKIPTVMISSISKDEGPMVFDALENGAVDYIQKPSLKDLDNVAPFIIERVKAAAIANVKNTKVKRSNTKPATAKVISHIDQDYLVAIGSSTGGTEALRHVFMDLPKNMPPIVVVQHIPPVFSAAFANRLNELCSFNVKEAENGDILQPENVYIAPGGKQMEVVKESGKYKVVITDAPPVNRHKPSVDVLFNSITKLKHDKILGLILTGMGADGAKGMLELKKKGAYTIAQNEESCVVYGMPKEAINMGAAHKVMHLDDMAEHMVSFLKGEVNYKKAS